MVLRVTICAVGASPMSPIPRVVLVSGLARLMASWVVRVCDCAVGASEQACSHGMVESFMGFRDTYPADYADWFPESWLIFVDAMCFVLGAAIQSLCY